MKKKIKMNTIESKKLIAEFMGYEILYRPYSNGFIKLSETELCDVEDLKYHTSWDALMPVVKAISDKKGWSLNATLEWLSESQDRDGLYNIEDIHKSVYGMVQHP
jgi:hypothetical protein